MLDFRVLLRPDEFVRYGRHICWGCRWKSQDRTNLYLSPYVEEPLNSKVIKCFVNEVFSVFRDSHILCIYVTNILCTFQISISGYAISLSLSLSIYIYIYIYILYHGTVCHLGFHAFSNRRTEALAWRLSQPGFDPSYGEILSSHTGEF